MGGGLPDDPTLADGARLRSLRTGGRNISAGSSSSRLEVSRWLVSLIVITVTPGSYKINSIEKNF